MVGGKIVRPIKMPESEIFSWKTKKSYWKADWSSRRLTGKKYYKLGNKKCPENVSAMAYIDIEVLTDKNGMQKDGT